MGGLLKSNPVVFLILNFLLYLFYGLVIGVSVVPSVCLVVFACQLNLFTAAILNICIVSLGIGLGVYLFFIVGLLVFGVVERILSVGFKPGKYKTDSAFFMRWLVYSGVHTISLSLILPYVQGSGFVKIYYSIVGCKLGKNVFINTVGLHDAYLLELGDNVVVGGKSDLTCHIFEGDCLLLGNIKVGDNVMIGANCYIMPGVTIGDHCDIGANSLIRKNKTIAPDTMLMPVPAMPARQVAGMINLSRKSNRKEELKL